MILITIEGRPIPYRAPNVNSRHTFNPRYQEAERVKWIIKSQHNAPILTTAVSISYIFNFAVPASLSQKKRLELIGKPYDKRPDTSNLLKFIDDCLVGIVIEDDSLICTVLVEKKYSEKENTIMMIRTIEG